MPIQPPSCKKLPVEHKLHGDSRLDNYAWLRDKDDPEMIKYLEQENEYTEEISNQTNIKELQQTVYEEFISRTKLTDVSVPSKKGNYQYYTRTEEGKEYNIHCRKRILSSTPGKLELGEEQILVDLNKIGEEEEFVEMGIFQPSPSHNLLAYGIDTEGDEMFTLTILDISTPTPTILYENVLEEIYYDCEWSEDNKFIFYTTLDDALRPNQVWRYQLGTNPEESVLIYEEMDQKYHVGLSSSADRRFLILHTESKVTVEEYLLPLNHPESPLRLVKPRTQGEEYHSEVFQSRLFIHSNANDQKNFFISHCELPPLEEFLTKNDQPIAPADMTDPAWTPFIPHNREIMLSSFVPYKSFFVLEEQILGLPRIQVIPLGNADSLKESVATQDPSEVVDHQVDWTASLKNAYFIDFPEPAFGCSLMEDEYPSESFRFRYSSLITPSSVFEYHVPSKDQTLLKCKEIPNYSSDQYLVERIEAVSEDGVSIPISLVRKKDLPLDGSAKCVLFGYGAYGLNYDATFSAKYFSYVDRGFVVAIAHIRGGGDNGRYWYDEGKLFHKKNTFHDFLVCAKHLIDQKYTSPERQAVYGASAGGLLIGAALNMAGNSLFSVAVASVPFVDIVTTLLDETLPLTITEWEEWGNPMEKDQYEYLKSYSPYDNITAKEYPHLLILGGLNDPRVHCSEPTKFCAKLRDSKTDSNLLLLKTNMGSGHFGVSGRYGAWKEDAFEYAFILNQLQEKE